MTAAMATHVTMQEDTIVEYEDDTWQVFGQYDTLPDDALMPAEELP